MSCGHDTGYASPRAYPRYLLSGLLECGVCGRSAPVQAQEPEPHPFGAADPYREVVETLRDSLEAEDIAAARPLLWDLIGPITAIPTESDGERYLTAHFPAFSVEGRLVAGARFVPSLSSPTGSA